MEELEERRGGDREKREEGEKWKGWRKGEGGDREKRERNGRVRGKEREELEKE